MHHLHTNAGVYSSDVNCTSISASQYYSDLFYFSMQTVSTVGYGSLAPYTTTNQVSTNSNSLQPTESYIHDLDRKLS